MIDMLLLGGQPCLLIMNLVFLLHAYVLLGHLLSSYQCHTLDAHLEPEGLTTTDIAKLVVISGGQRLPMS